MCVEQRAGYDSIKRPKFKMRRKLVDAVREAELPTYLPYSNGFVFEPVVDSIDSSDSLVSRTFLVHPPVLRVERRVKHVQTEARVSLYVVCKGASCTAGHVSR